MSDSNYGLVEGGAAVAPLIRAQRLTKWYGKVTALQDITLELGPGVWGLLGPNGSGKTTFLQLAAGQIRAPLGSIQVCGMAPFANPDALRFIGLCPEADALYENLTGLEFVSAMAELSGYNRKEAKERSAAALEAFGLDEAMNRATGGYSRGMRQRVKLAQSVVHEPRVLLLDEPLTGTDPTSRATILEEIHRRAEAGACVVFSTHVLPELEAVTDNILLIARGQLVAQGRTHEIRSLLEGHPHHVQILCDRPRDLASALAHVEGIVGMQFAPGGLEAMTYDPDSTYMAIAAAALDMGVEVTSITSPDANLESLFHSLVEHGSRGAGTGSDRAVGGAQYGRQVAGPGGAS